MTSDAARAVDDPAVLARIARMLRIADARPCPDLESHYKIRVVIPGAILHLASATEPRLIHDRGTLADVQADWITDPNYGDTIGHIAWPAVAAITWRWTE